MENIIQYRSTGFHYEIAVLQSNRVQIRIKDKLNCKIYTADFARRNGKPNQRIDQYEAAYHQFIWQNKAPKGLLSLDHTTQDIVLHLANIKRIYRFKYKILDAPLSEEELRSKQKMEKQCQQIMKDYLQRFIQNMEKITERLFEQFQKRQANYLEMITRKHEDAETKLESLMNNKITEANLTFQAYFLQTYQHIQNKIKSAQQNLLDSHYQILNQQQLITENLQQNLGDCNQNIKKLETVIKVSQNYLEDQLGEVKEKVEEASNRLNFKIQIKDLIQTLQKYQLIQLKPNHQCKGTKENQYLAVDKCYPIQGKRQLQGFQNLANGLQYQKSLIQTDIEDHSISNNIKDGELKQQSGEIIIKIKKSSFP